RGEARSVANDPQGTWRSAAEHSQFLFCHHDVYKALLYPAGASAGPRRPGRVLPPQALLDATRKMGGKMTRYLTVAMVVGCAMFSASSASAQVVSGWQDKGGCRPIGRVWYGPERDVCGRLAEHRCVPQGTELPPKVFNCPATKRASALARLREEVAA